MNYWIIPSNNKTYRLHDYLSCHKVVDWRQNKYKYQPGDIVFIYCSLPEACIKYVMLVESTNIPENESIPDKEYWGKKHSSSGYKVYFRMSIITSINTELLDITHLLQNGLLKAPQGSMHVPDKLLKYINQVLDKKTYDSIDKQNNILLEGNKVLELTNKYERNPIARAKCIQLKGTTCAICGFNFEKQYGEVGKDFIHIHHIKPIASYNQTHQIDFEKDLIPVCPNCHAMLHRKFNDRYLSVEELKEILRKNKF